MNIKMTLFLYVGLGAVYVYTIHSFFEAYFFQIKASMRYFHRIILIAYFLTANFNNAQLNLIINLAFLTALAFCYESKKLNKLVSVGLIYILAMASEVVTMSVAGLILDLDAAHMMEQDKYALTLTAISKLIFLVMVQLINPIIVQTRKRRNVKLPQYYVAMVFAIPVFSIVIIRTLYQTIQEGAYDAFSVLAISLLLLINFLVFYLYDKLLKNSAAELDVTMLRQQIEMYNKSYIDMGTSQEKIKTLAHNYKNNLLWLYAQVQRGESLERLKTDIQSMVGEVNELTNYCYTGIPLIDTIINHKASYAEQFGIKLETKLDVPRHLAINERNFSVLLGNALDNAIEACQTVELQHRSIHIFMAEDRCNLIIEISNPCAGTLKLDAENNPLTTKENPKAHGYGLKSMRHIVDEMEGFLSISVEHSVFMLRVILFGAFITEPENLGAQEKMGRLM